MTRTLTDSPPQYVTAGSIRSRSSCGSTVRENPTDAPREVLGESMSDKVVKSDAEWRAQLSPEEYHVAREKGTERAFTGRYVNHHEDGTYTCVGCGAPLF